MRNQIDVTGRIEVYPKGKTLECDCGQDIGVGMNRMMIKCQGCGRTLVDHDAEKRSFEPDGDAQSSLSQWT